MVFRIYLFYVHVISLLPAISGEFSNLYPMFACMFHPLYTLDALSIIPANPDVFLYLYDLCFDFIMPYISDVLPHLHGIYVAFLMPVISARFSNFFAMSVVIILPTIYVPILRLHAQTFFIMSARFGMISYLYALYFLTIPV